ncbi:MAG: ATP-binding protein [Planctomycetota bacterium]
MNDSDVLDALRAVLDRDGGPAPLWLLCGELCTAAGAGADAVAALRKALDHEATRARAERRIVPALRQARQLAEALIRIEDLIALHPTDGELHVEHARVLRARGSTEEAERAEVRARECGKATSLDEAAPAPAAKSADEDREVAAAGVEDQLDPKDWASQFDWSGIVTTFQDVAGLEAVKRQIRLKIIAPFENPEVYRAFGRSGGGGILLYGPPGCGKTFIARAVAGECRARFVAVGIHEIVDKYWGESEKLVHSLFEEARRQAPTVLFFDEFDALGGGRGRAESQFWKTLVDQLLQEMDGVSRRNEGVLLFAATNMPWNVDPAFRRPGRFDRVLFVPPPDEAAREAILTRAIAKLPGGAKVDVRKLVKPTALMTGADLVALVERAAEKALEASLQTKRIHQVDTADLLDACKQSRGTAEEWIATARNYVRYANEGGQYDELAEFLRSIKRL